MYRHLVTIKVCIVCRANQRMKLNGFAIYELRFECLYAETVQCGCAVKENRMLFNTFLKHIPYFRSFFFHYLLCILYSGGKSLLY